MLTVKGKIENGKILALEPIDEVFEGKYVIISLADAREFVKEAWADSFFQLEETQKAENYNTNVEMPSENTVSAISRWINEGFKIAPDLDAPDVVPDAEGGLDIEWMLENKTVVIHIDHSDRLLNRIFVKEGKKHHSEELNRENLEAVLTK